MAKLLKVNLIVSTGHNNWAMSNAVDSVAKTYVHGPDVQEGMLKPGGSCHPSLRPVPFMLHARDRPDAHPGGNPAPDGKLIRTLQRDSA